MDLPLELREMIWRAALPEARTFNALVYASASLKMQILERAPLKMLLTQVCFESRRVVKESGYVLAFRDEDRQDDPGLWFNPRKDVIERTIWGPGDFWGLKT
jgi:predicted GNAT superfamily acetyltransferase